MHIVDDHDDSALSRTKMCNWDVKISVFFSDMKTDISWFMGESNQCSVAGHEGRAGMASFTIRPDCVFDGKKLFENVMAHLPAYARPLFIRIQVSLCSL